MESRESNDPAEHKQAVDPDQLLKLLELQRKAGSKERLGRDTRNAFRIWSLIIILAATALALWVLQWMLSQMAPPAEHRVKPAVVESPR